MDAKDTINLPLTTTKKGIDATSEIYQSVLPLMKNAMIQILDFLKKIPAMKASANEYREMLCDTLNSINTVHLKSDEIWVGYLQKNFIPPKLDMDLISQKKQSVRIAYDVNKTLADSAKSYSHVPSYKDLGQLTFDYYIQLEQITNE